MKNQIFYKKWRFRFSWKLFGVSTFIFFSPCLQAQTIDSSEQNKNNQPDVHINVNREFDKNGNIIRYDSTYSWSWSSDGNKVIPDNFFNDSLTGHFTYPFEDKMFFDDPFLNLFDSDNDSLQNRIFNFPNTDYFEKQMLEMMQHQQQIMNELFRQPPLNSAPDKKNNRKDTPDKKTSGKGEDI
ncbi:MAG: hypothetical protein COS14_02440 [Bacteroidetes bacterium CG02_land_8_20_14_3_00_31_25]|nr:MAG: hypothetical protein COX07_08520 [Bacteroidetes bacterium CG23_combo_of_CG06-09_8_20_14_all_32_9]PIV62245.1 MAG: hypothetical protein COS14_02440 [Bacteroidetes bacterium CG02_land_8_20_14_3_00_31_25]